MDVDVMQRVVAALEELQGDTSTPRHVKERVASTIQMLSEDAETSIKVSKALSELESIAEDATLQSYTRSEIFNIVSLLEVV